MSIGEAFGETFRSLKIRNFRVFYVGQFISQSGTWMTMVALTLLVLELGGRGIDLGLLAACQFGPVLLLGAWAGTIVDRSSKRVVILATQVAGMTQSLGLAALMLGGIASLPAIYGLATFQGIVTAFDNPARRSFVVEMVPLSHFPNAVSLNSTIQTGSRVFGPVFAGVSTLTIGYGWTFLLDAFTYVPIVIGIATMTRSDLYPTQRARRGKGQVREGVRYLMGIPDLWIPMVMMIIIGTVALNLPVTTPLLALGPLGGTEQTYTWLYSTMALTAAVGALSTARRETVKLPAIIGSAVLFGLGMFVMGLAPSLWVAFIGSAIVGFGSTVFMTSTTANIHLRADPSYRGRVLALQAMVFVGSTPIGGPLVGWVADAYGARSSVMLGGVSCFVAAVWARASLRRESSGGGVGDPASIAHHDIDGGAASQASI